MAFFFGIAFISASFGTVGKAVRLLGSMHCGQRCQLSSFPAKSSVFQTNTKITVSGILAFYITQLFFAQKFGQHLCVGSLRKLLQGWILINLTKSMLWKFIKHLLSSKGLCFEKIFSLLNKYIPFLINFNFRVKHKQKLITYLSVLKKFPRCEKDMNFTIVSNRIFLSLRLIIY